MALTLEVIGLKKTQVRIEDLGKFKLDMKIAAQKGRTNVISHFQKSEGPGGKWAPLKARKGKPLQDTGRLMGSINARAAKRKATIFTKVNYAGFHDRGTSRIPMRKFMWISKSIRKEIAEAVLKKWVK